MSNTTNTTAEVTGYRTAISRRTLSKPMRHLVKLDVLPCPNALDYGCGRGQDADTLGMAKYAPHWHPCPTPLGIWDVVTCNYVLNVVTPEVQADILAHIRNLLAEYGVAYITVRRDLKADVQPGRGCTHRNVVLDLPVEQEVKGSYCMYRLDG